MAHDGEADELQIARDRRLARRMQRGDERAIKAFCDQYLPKLYRYAVSRLPNVHDVDDVCQIVLTNAARRIETYRAEATLLTWLVSICRREINRHLVAVGSASNGHARFDGEADVEGVLERLEAPESDRPDAVLSRLELMAELELALDQLPEQYAEALELKYVDGLTSKEIASRMRIGDVAAQSLLARARRAFRALCDEKLARRATSDANTGGRA